MCADVSENKFFFFLFFHLFPRYIGIRDFNVEKLDADFGVTVGHNKEILLNVTNVFCVASVYKFKLTGPSLLGKALNQLSECCGVLSKIVK